MYKRDSELRLEKINQLGDDQLPKPEKAGAMTRLENDPLAQETRQAWQAQREALRALHCPLLDEPIFGTLLAAARRSQQGRQWCRGGMTAAVVLTFDAGWPVGWTRHAGYGVRPETAGAGLHSTGLGGP